MYSFGHETRKVIERVLLDMCLSFPTVQSGPGVLHEVPSEPVTSTVFLH